MSAILTKPDETRLTQMRTRVQAQNGAGLYRTAAYTLVGANLRTTIGESIQIRRAKAIACLLDQVKLYVFPEEPIVGSMMGLWELETGLPSYDEQKATAIEAIDAYLVRKSEKKLAKRSSDDAKAKPMEEAVAENTARWALMSRVHHDASLDYANYQRMLADMEEHFADTGIQRFEIGKVLEATLRVQYDEQDKKIMSDLPWLPGNHLGLDYEVVITKGLRRMSDEITANWKATDDPEKIEFYTSVDIVIRSMIAFVKRYAKEVANAANVEGTTEARKQELALMADVLDKLSESPADTFREALQGVWLLHVMSNIVGGSAMSFSRFDQYMYPFYKKDIGKGVPREEIKELVSCFWLKINEPKLRTVQSMTVGGVHLDGSDASTDLTKLCLEVARDMKLPYPNIAVRTHKNTPEWVYDAILDTVSAGCGQPMVLNDDVFVENFKKLGYPDEIANDYFNMGCVELMFPGKQPLWGGTKSVVYTNCLEETLNAFTTGKIKADTFEEFMDYYLSLIRDGIRQSREHALKRKQNILETCYDPFCSILTQDCIARGKDMHHGGSVCPTHWSVYAHGLGTLTDSLAAIKKFVYDEKRITLENLIKVLDVDFAGNEDIQIMLDRGTPYFGNDIDSTDEIANRVFYELTKNIFDLNSMGDEDKYVATFFSYFSHVLSGEVTKATPNGRRAGESLSDSMAPTQGKDVNGPTRMLNSVLKIDPSYITGGYALNIKVTPSLAKTAQGTKALKGLLKAYLMSKGPQIQINYVDADALKDAQVHPEKHRDLVVRVGGYCEYFVNLDHTLQNEIIQRTMHEAE